MLDDDDVYNVNDDDDNGKDDDNEATAGVAADLELVEVAEPQYLPAGHCTQALWAGVE